MGNHDRRQRELLAACWDDYDNDAPRLAYADWLDSVGDPADSARAETIRVSIRRDSLHQRMEGADWKRIAELTRKHRSAWFAGLPDELAGPSQPHMVRGLFEVSPALAPRQLQASGERWFRRCPPDFAFHVRLQTEPPRRAAKLPPVDWAGLFAQPWWDRVLMLHAFDAGVPAAGCVALAANPAFRRLRHLELTFCPVGDEGGLALAASPHLANLGVLNLARCDLGGASAVALAARAHMPRLETLYLRDNPRIDNDAWDVIRRTGGAAVQMNFPVSTGPAFDANLANLPPAGADDDIPF
jgi:uncharacterized protein (TIGR02996 family)